MGFCTSRLRPHADPEWKEEDLGTLLDGSECALGYMIMGWWISRNGLGWAMRMRRVPWGVARLAFDVGKRSLGGQACDLSSAAARTRSSSCEFPAQYA